MGNPSYDLICAVREGRLQRVRELINTYGLSYSKVWSDGYGYMLLRDAVKYKHTEVAKLLLVEGCKVNSKNKNHSNTPLHFAVRNGNIEIVQMLLSRSADVHAKNEYGCTPVHNAIGNDKITKLLLNHVASVNATNHDYLSPLLLAVMGGCVQTVENLLKRGAHINCRFLNPKRTAGYTPLHFAVRNRNEEVINLLLIRGANVDAKSDDATTSLHIAVENASLEIVQQLLIHGANVNNATSSQLKEGYTPLHLAAEKGSEDMILLLLSSNADIKASAKDNSTPLHIAAKSGHGKVVKLLLEHGANVDAQTRDGMTTLFYAVEEECTNVVEALLEYNANVNLIINDVTPLRASVKKGNVVISKMLLDKGANVYAKNKKGISALHIATQYGHKGVVEVLLNYGAKVDSKLKHDITSIHLAARKGFLEIIKLLLKFGADINSRDEYDRTALHIASNEGHVQVVRALLESGSDINIVTRDDCTPLDCAVLYYFYSTYFDSDDSDEEHFLKDPCGISIGKIIADILKQHIVKLWVANLYLCELNIWAVRNDYDFDLIDEEYFDFRNECDLEIQILKSEKINDNVNVTFHDILTKSTSQLALYARNENIVQVLKSDDYKTKFPLYACIISNNFRKGFEIAEFLEQGIKFFHTFCDIYSELPYNCTEEIFSYLSNNDLKSFIDACKLNKY